MEKVRYKEMQLHPGSKDFLRKNGFIYTVRKYYKPDETVRVLNVGVCNCKSLGAIPLSKLPEYLKDSGFNTMEEWIQKFKYFIHSGDSKIYLYHIEIAEQ